MKYQIITYGCQMNMSDSERIAATIESANYKKTSKIEEADLIVVTMCSVRQSAVDRIFGLIPKFRALKINNPKLKIILTGCVLNKDKQKFSRAFDYVLNIKEIAKLPQIIELKPRKDYSLITLDHPKGPVALLPIMTGCNNFCSYCVVPFARGREISRPTKDILREFKNLIKNRHKEIWLLGQNVNSYEDGKINFPGLLKIIDEIPGNYWVRFTSPHPKDFSEELIDAMASAKKITPYLNLPVQSGDDAILKKMNRSYTISRYKNLVKKIRDRIPGICLSTDAIVGFPGETKKQFNNTSKLFREVKYDMAYISEYSSRPGTAASKMNDNVPKKEKARRKEVLNEILKKTALQNNQVYLGKKIRVLVEGKKNGDTWLAKTRTYKTVQFQSPQNVLGKFVDVKITSALAWGLEGKLCEKK